VDGLSPAAPVIAFDLPGFGDSELPREGWSVGDYAELVLEAMDGVGVERFSIVGHSFGARVAIVLASTRPERVERLVLTGAAGIPPRRKPSYYGKVAAAKVGKAAAKVGGRAGATAQERIRQRVASQDWLDAPEALRATFRLVIAEDLTPRLPDVAAPTLLVWGEADEDTPLWMGKRMEELIPNAGLVVFDGAGHYAYADRLADFVRVTRHFLVEQVTAVAHRA
jgi:pimeloyl-ACP methyl ester carboxylesterase